MTGVQTCALPILTPSLPTASLSPAQIQQDTPPPQLTPPTPPQDAPPPPPQQDSETDSSSGTVEHGESENSISTVTLSPPRRPVPPIGPPSNPDHHSAPCRPGGPRLPEEEEEREEEEGEEGERRRGGRKLSLSLWEGSAGSPQFSGSNLHQPWVSYMRSASYASSDDTESEEEESWDELQELRER